MALINKKDIPHGARLELRWSKAPGTTNDFQCEYLLMLPVAAEWDVRKNTLQFEHESQLLKYTLSETYDGHRAGIEWSPLYEDAQRLHLPYRDGKHIEWDSAQLGNLPMWVTYEEHAMSVEGAFKEFQNQVG